MPASMISNENSRERERSSTPLRNSHHLGSPSNLARSSPKPEPTEYSTFKIHQPQAQFPSQSHSQPSPSNNNNNNNINNSNNSINNESSPEPNSYRFKFV